MSLSDALSFEAFNLKDMWKGIKKDPKRLLLGVDPASTWAWNKVLGRDDDPIVSQLGGPTKGTYRRAQEAGIDTGTASTLHGLASIIAGSWGAAGAGSALGGAFGGGGAQPGLWNQGFAGTSGFGGAPYGSAPASGIPGIAGPVGGATGGGAAGMSGMDFAKLGMNAMGGAPQGQGGNQQQSDAVRKLIAMALSREQARNQQQNDPQRQALIAALNGQLWTNTGMV